MGGGTCIVKSGKDSWGSTLLDEITDNLVVEVFDWCPFDLFPHVLLLLRLECKLNEDLLKLLIDVVDAQLLERIVLLKLMRSWTLK